MSELPEVRRADCGHGFLPVDTAPAARVQNGQHEQPVYLCDDCRVRLRQPAPKVETKQVTAAAVQTTSGGAAAGPVETPAVGVAVRKMQYELPRNAELEADVSPYHRGQQAAMEGATEEDCPHADRRTKDAREWLRGFREERDKA